VSHHLRIYTSAQILLGFTALAIATLLLPLDARIAVDLPGVPPEATVAFGVLFWVVLTLGGSAIVAKRPTGAILTFDLPFITAATVLGGPVAGGWVAMIGSFELREIRGLRRHAAGGETENGRRVPWYGVLANHAMGTFPAIVAGMAVLAVRPLLGPRLESSATAGDLVWTLAVAAIVVALSDALAFETLALRSDRSFGDMLEDFGQDYWLMMAAEAIVAWLMVEVFLLSGWWAPVVCVAALVAIWRGQPQDTDKVDSLTGLWSDREFLRRTERLLARRLNGGRRVVMMIVELNELDLINRRYGRDVGDQVLRAVGRRLQTSLRPLDDVARLEAGRFAALLVLPRVDPGAPKDRDVASTLAWRTHRRVTAEVEIEGKAIEIRASIGVASEERKKRPVTAIELLDAAKRAAGQAIDRGVPIV
jgi:diguanylate cyclase (GGDEF)-like protein